MTQWQLLVKSLAKPVFLPPVEQELSAKDKRIVRYILDYLDSGEKTTSSVAQMLGVNIDQAKYQLDRLRKRGKISREVRQGYGKGGKGNKTNITYWGLI